MISRWRHFLTSPDDDCQTALLDAVRGATHSITVLIYALTYPPLIDALIAKHQAGLEVSVVADRSQSTGHAERPQLQRLVDAGIPLVIAESPTGQINHEKVILLDQMLGVLHNQSSCCFGSFNLSFGAQRQENNLTIDNDPTICDYLQQQYEETLAVGTRHPEWQLTPTTTARGARRLFRWPWHTL